MYPAREKRWTRRDGIHYSCEDRCRVRMMLIHNFTPKEIAFRLGRSVGSVYVFLHSTGQQARVAQARYRLWRASVQDWPHE